MSSVGEGLSDHSEARLNAEVVGSWGVLIENGQLQDCSCAFPLLETEADGFRKDAIVHFSEMLAGWACADQGHERANGAEMRCVGLLELCEAIADVGQIVSHSNLSLVCVETAKVEASAVPSRLGSLEARDGGPSQSVSSADHWWLAFDLATRLTGAGERPVIAAAMPAVPLRSDDGATSSEISTPEPSSPVVERPVAEFGTAPSSFSDGTTSLSTASPANAGTPC